MPIYSIIRFILKLCDRRATTSICVAYNVNTKYDLYTIDLLLCNRFCNDSLNFVDPVD